MTLSTSVSKSAVRLAKAAGRYRDWGPDEHITRQAETVEFRGDVPSMAGTEPNQRRLIFEIPQPLVTEARRVDYTRRGMAWIDGTLERRFSFEEVGFRQIADLPGRPRRHYAEASILQSQTPRTYGDWVSEHLASLARTGLARQIVEPLLLPQRWFVEPYVQRDLKRLGIRAEAVDQTVRIDRARVINKTRFSHYWVKPEVDAIIAAMRIERRPCRPGSAIYLSRRGERGQGSPRELNNAVTETAMKRNGIEVIRTAGLTLDDYLRLSASAETVFFDHGSAVYNVMHWQTRRLVELCAPTYWDGSFLFLADSLGIHDYHVWQIDPGIDDETLAARIAAVRAEPCRVEALAFATPEPVVERVRVRRFR